MILAASSQVSKVDTLALYPIGLGAGLILLYCILRIWGKDPIPRGPAPVAAWRPADALLVVLGWYLLTSLAMGVAIQLGSPAHWAASAARLTSLPIVIVVLVLIHRRGHPHGPRFMSLIFGLGVFAATLPVVALSLIGWTELLELFGRTWKEQRLLTTLRGNWPAFFLSAVVLAPLSEEVIFRGLLFPALKRWSGKWPGILLSALVFALVHEVAVMFPMFLLGVVLAWAYERAGTLAAPMAFHVAFNGWTFIQQLSVSG